MQSRKARPSSKVQEPQPLVIEVGHQGDGNVYELDADSQTRILNHFPEAQLARRLFLGTYGPQDLKKIKESRWREIAKLLTGLGDEQIHQIGGLLVFDPVAARPLWKWQSA